MPSAAFRHSYTEGVYVIPPLSAVMKRMVMYAMAAVKPAASPRHSVRRSVRRIPYAMSGVTAVHVMPFSFMKVAVMVSISHGM